MIKKNLIYVALLLALVSCAKTEWGKALSNHPICFRQPVIETPVKGMITGTSYPEALSFDAWGYYSSKADVDPASAGVNGIEYFADAPCTRQDTRWVPTYTYTVGNTSTPGYYYWYKDMGYMTFQALSPHHETNNEAWLSHSWSTGFQFTGYSVADTPGSQEDLMYTHFTVPTQRSSAPNDGVDLVFHHALSAIKFRFMIASVGLDNRVVITAVRIAHAYKTGDFAENKTPGALNAAYAATPRWSNQQTEHTYTVFSGSQTLTAVETGDLGNPLLAIPQDLNHGDQQVSVEIDYTLDSTDKTVTATLYGLKSGETPVNSWEIGKCYTYTVTMGLEKITFTPNLDNWSSGENWLPIG